MNPWEMAELAARLLAQRLGGTACVDVLAAVQDEESCTFSLRVRAVEAQMLIEGVQAPAGSAPQA